MHSLYYGSPIVSNVYGWGCQRPLYEKICTFELIYWINKVFCLVLKAPAAAPHHPSFAGVRLAWHHSGSAQQTPPCPPLRKLEWKYINNPRHLWQGLGHSQKRGFLRRSALSKPWLNRSFNCNSNRLIRVYTKHHTSFPSPSHHTSFLSSGSLTSFPSSSPHTSFPSSSLGTFSYISGYHMLQDCRSSVVSGLPSCHNASQFQIILPRGGREGFWKQSRKGLNMGRINSPRNIPSRTGRDRYGKSNSYQYFVTTARTMRNIL